MKNAAQFDTVFKRKYFWWQKSGALAVLLGAMAVFFPIFLCWFAYWTWLLLFIPMVILIYGAIFSSGWLRRFALIIFFQLGLLLICRNLFVIVVDGLLLLFSSFYSIFLALNILICEPWFTWEGQKVRQEETPVENENSSIAEADCSLQTNDPAAEERVAAVDDR